jgi:hypothetical protein
MAVMLALSASRNLPPGSFLIFMMYQGYQEKPSFLITLIKHAQQDVEPQNETHDVVRL